MPHPFDLFGEQSLERGFIDPLSPLFPFVDSDEAIAQGRISSKVGNMIRFELHLNQIFDSGVGVAMVAFRLDDRILEDMLTPVARENGGGLVIVHSRSEERRVGKAR